MQGRDASVTRDEAQQGADPQCRYCHLILRGVAPGVTVRTVQVSGWMVVTQPDSASWVFAVDRVLLRSAEQSGATTAAGEWTAA